MRPRAKGSRSGALASKGAVGGDDALLRWWRLERSTSWAEVGGRAEVLPPLGGDETSWAPAQTWDLTIGKLWASGPADGPGPLKEQD